MAGYGGGYQSDQGQSPGAGSGASSAGVYGAIADILMKRTQDFTYNWQNLDDSTWLMRHFPNFFGWNSQGGGGGGYQEPQQAPTQTTFQNVGAGIQNQGQFDQSLNYKKQQDAESNALMEKWMQMQAGGGGNAGKTSGGMGWRIRS